MIKYHLNGVGNEYGADHKLTNNWNPYEDYGNEYADVYFRIEARDYQYPFNDFTADKKEQFYNEVYNVFKSLGWEVDISDGIGCMTIQKGKQNLYLHPQEFSGEVLKNEVKQIAEALEQHETFKLRWVDIYRTVYDISDKEYETYLESRNGDIRTLLFEKCQTNRTNKYAYLYDIECNVAELVKLRRINIKDDRNNRGQTHKFIDGVIDEMIADGLLIYAEQNGYRLVRSLNKTEQKKMKISICA